MQYITTSQAAEKLNVTKRYIAKLCVDNQIDGAYKKGSRWQIPLESILKLADKEKITQRYFNTTGICNPDEHYMINLEERLAQVASLVNEGKYFTINRARQYGKTTTLHALTEYLQPSYFVVSMDFQMQMSNAKFKNENTFSLAFARAFVTSFGNNEDSKLPEFQAAIKVFSDSFNGSPEYYELVELFQALSNLCRSVPKKMILMIDEVDTATNNQVFLDFLGQLRGYYINRSVYPTFHSVILAGVCDIKNLKRKLRPDEEHKDNSPWNIAADFDISMSFSTSQISEMLKDYANDKKFSFSLQELAQDIFDYTQGYPYLVSRICQLIDEKQDKALWSHNGILEAVRLLVKEANSLFDDMSKKIKDYPALRKLIYDILFCGRSIPFNIGTELVAIGSMFGFLKDENGQVAISNRIFEIWFYNLFIAEEALDNATYSYGQRHKNEFVKGDNLDVELILQRFVKHFSETFTDKDERFIEDNGRKLFLLYIRPLINGIGNYYIESRTRSLGRTDLIIDYKGNQYVIEMKIWHGDEYNRRGEEQLIGYLEDYKLQKGYLLSFNFNKNKEVGLKELHFKDYTLVEAIV